MLLMLQYLSCRPEAWVVSCRRGHQGPAEPQTCSRRVPETPADWSPIQHHQRQPAPAPDISQHPHSTLQRSGARRTQIEHTHTHPVQHTHQHSSVYMNHTHTSPGPLWPSQHLLCTFGTFCRGTNQSRVGFPVKNALTIYFWSRLLSADRF